MGAIMHHDRSTKLDGSRGHCMMNWIWDQLEGYKNELVRLYDMSLVLFDARKTTLNSSKKQNKREHQNHPQTKIQRQKY
jgi:hypothetical protein